MGPPSTDPQLSPTWAWGVDRIVSLAGDCILGGGQGGWRGPVPPGPAPAWCLLPPAPAWGRWAQGQGPRSRLSQAGCALGRQRGEGGPLHGTLRVGSVHHTRRLQHTPQKHRCWPQTDTHCDTPTLVSLGRARHRSCWEAGSGDGVRAGEGRWAWHCQREPCWGQAGGHGRFSEKSSQLYV